MRTASYGRLLFGVAAVLFGVIALLWHDADTWQNMATLWRLPFGTGFGQCLMVAQLAGGIALVFPRSVRAGSVILGVVYLIFAVACTTRIAVAPRSFGQYDSFFEQLALLCGAAAAHAITNRYATRSTTLVRCSAFGLGLSALSFGLAQIVYFKFTVSLVPSWIPPNHAFWAILTTIAFFLAAIALVTGYRSTLAAHSMALMVALFAVLVWVPLLIAQPRAHGSWSEFALTLLIAGASWTIGDSSPLRRLPYLAT